jgi:hypothetical protein
MACCEYGTRSLPRAPEKCFSLIGSCLICKQGLRVTSTLAYYKNWLHTAVKSFITSAPGSVTQQFNERRPDISAQVHLPPLQHVLADNQSPDPGASVIQLSFFVNDDATSIGLNYNNIRIVSDASRVVMSDTTILSITYIIIDDTR